MSRFDSLLGLGVFPNGRRVGLNAMPPDLNMRWLCSRLGIHPSGVVVIGNSLGLTRVPRRKAESRRPLSSCHRAPVGFFPSLAVACEILLFACAAIGSDREIWVHVAGGLHHSWDGDLGYSVSTGLILPVGSGRFRVGGEIEYRRLQANVKQGFSPDYDSVLLRNIIQYLPLRHATVSPYLGLGWGFALHIVDRYGRRDGARRRYRERFSGGSTLMGLIGFETQLFADDRSVGFMEGRFESVSDIWKVKGGNWQYEELGGFSAICGVRVRF